VTTILGQLSKPALVNWSAKEVATYAAENMDAWQNLPPSDAIDLLKRAPYRNMTKRQNIGSAVHTAIESWQGGEPVVEDLDLLPYVAAAVGFLDGHTTELLEQEATVFSRQYLYAGTLDAIVTLKDGRIAIVDWKTGKAIYPEAALQLCAYANAEFVGTADGTEHPLPEIDLGIVVHLKDDGTYVAREVEFSTRMFKTFVALRTVQLWRDDHEQHALGETRRGPDKKEADSAAGNTDGRVVRLRPA